VALKIFKSARAALEGSTRGVDLPPVIALEFDEAFHQQQVETIRPVTLRGSYVRDLSDDAKLSLTVGYSWIDSFSLGTFGTLNDIQPSYGLLDAPDLAAALERLFAGVTALDSSRP